MKVVVSIIFAFSVLLQGCASGSKSHKDFKLRSYKDLTTKNGMRVLLIKDSGLPYFTMMMLVRTGSVSDPKDKKGLTSMVAGLMSKGTKSMSATEVAESFGQIGSEFSASVTSDFTLFQASTLSSHQSELLKNFSEVIVRPVFTQTEVDRYKKQTLSAFASILDDPSSVASLAIEKYLYETHPYSYSSSGTKDGVVAIKRQDIVNHYQKFIRPNNVDLAVVGDFDDDIMMRLEGYFDGWDQAPVSGPVLSSIPQIDKIQIQIVDKGDLGQAQIRLAHIGIPRKHPDYLALKVANTILGGGFASRLMDEIRIKRGLTYGVSSEFDARRDQGPFIVSTFTRVDKVGDTVKESLAVIDKFKKDGVTKEEVENAKALIKGQFPRALETAELTASNLLQLRYYGVPDSYLSNFLEDIDNISRSDVNRVIQAYFHPDKMKIVVHAPKEKVTDQLNPLGEASSISYDSVMQ